jgi:hypothetical protein
MKTADEYAELAEEEQDAAARRDAEPEEVAYHLGQGITCALLASAAATLEAARLMGPTPEDQARLDALLPSAEDVRGILK